MPPASVVSMMHLNTATLRGYREKRLAPAGLLAADEHLVECDECREALLDHDGGAAADDIIEALTSEDEHLGYDALEGWVDDGLSPQERRAASDHLQHCARCASDLADLRGVAAALPTTARSARHGMTLRVAATVLLAILGGASWLAIHYRTRSHSPAAVSVASTARPVASLRDGSGTVSFGADGALAGIALSGADATVVRDVLANGRLTVDPRVKALRGERGTLMGASAKNTFEAVSPLGTFVRDPRPQFTWTKMSDGATYRVEIYDDARKLVLESQPLQGLEWTPDRDLTRGREYVWQVVAMSGGKRIVAPQPPSAEAHFGVIDESAAARLAAISKTYGQSHLLLAAAAAREGLLDDARRELDALAALNPHSATVANLARSLPPR
jgi:hypothetical protein